MGNPECQSEIYLEGLPIRCDLDLGHRGVFHSHTSVEDCYSDEEARIQRPGADVVILWAQRQFPVCGLTKSEKGEKSHAE